MDEPTMFYYCDYDHATISTENILTKSYTVAETFSESIDYSKNTDCYDKICTIWIDVVPARPKMYDLSAFSSLDSIYIKHEIYAEMANLYGLYNFANKQISIYISGPVWPVKNSSELIKEMFPVDSIDGRKVNTELLPVWSGQRTKSARK